jgi:hypothetical protein
MEEEPADETPEELSPDPEYKAEETGGQWSFGDMEEEPADETPEELSPDPEYKAEGPEQWSIRDVEEEQTGESSIGIPDYSFTGSLTDTFDISSADPRSVDQVVSESVEMPGAPAGPEAGSDNSKPALLDAAEKFISEGEYTGAISAYQRILSANPDDKQTLQRMEELRSLLKLMGREKDFLVSKLNAFLNAIQKRGDEFFRSA